MAAIEGMEFPVLSSWRTPDATFHILKTHLGAMSGISRYLLWPARKQRRDGALSLDI
jgi:hypothetical protein